MCHSSNPSSDQYGGLVVSVPQTVDRASQIFSFGNVRRKKGETQNVCPNIAGLQTNANQTTIAALFTTLRKYPDDMKTLLCQTEFSVLVESSKESGV